ncbi:hypothetical protein TTHERM_00655470 (macronuclear) [Tetrahymena thermophila SB210]|uniref:Uncharacterized protein n=1 Tax=Tetrahymena thermophila (strain SB210) TaxID=312017 RepID=Q22H05_TETTS|nr:hypothetical protein TTHERM_00655470 [Tetrahymena thermophila SB210]EAR84519.1 hypothetical protein TTHERM_00655470 [Tetrahymena thermophila SB210]|eukprot:XP_001032182.1 hypothetical protein TTHERM_00655470 [Tetrahymena thermophila SB210]
MSRTLSELNLQDQKQAFDILQRQEQSFKHSITQNQFRSTFTKLSKQKKNDLPDIYNLKKDTPVDIFKPKDGQYQNLNFKPKMNLTNKDFYQPLQYVLRPRKIKNDDKKDEEQIVVGKKPSMKIFENKQNPKPVKSIYKFQIEEENWVDSVKPPRSSMNPLHLVPNPTQNKEDLEVKKANIQVKNIKTPFKNEFIGNQINNNEEITQKIGKELEEQFNNNETLKKEFQEFLKWQNQTQKGMSRSTSQNHFYKNNSNITNQDHIIQIAKCLILTHNNSPSNLKNKRVITLGRPGDDFLRVTKYKDQIYYEKKMERDKVNQNWNEVNGNFDELHYSSYMKGQQNLKISRLSKGIVEQQKPDLKCVYPLKIVFNKNKRLDVSVKRLNRKRVDYLNQIYAKHMMAYLYNENKHHEFNDNNPDEQNEYGFEDLQNGIYVTTIPPQ